MLYENIINEDQLREFVDSLNKITHYEKYLLFIYIFDVRLHKSVIKDASENGVITYQQWKLSIGEFMVYITVKLNRYLFIDSPEKETGIYDNIFFHIDSNDKNGISQI